MNEKKHEYGFESYQRASTALPAIECFSDTKNLETTWLKDVARNKELLDQLKSRQELNERLAVVLSRSPQPDVSLQDATAQGLLTEEQVGDLYTSLSALLENDPEYQRIILYIPFEFLPSTTWKPSSQELRQAAERFRAAYMSAWNNLLRVHDVRANFVDGDVLDMASRVEDLPRVVKAAHLIPKLVEKGFLKVTDAVTLMERNDDPILTASITDTLPVLADLGYMSSSESNTESERTPAIKKITLSSTQKELQKNFERIDAEEYGDITKKRIAWLRQEKKRLAIASAGDDVNAAIAHKGLSDAVVAEFITPEADAASQEALVDGIRKAIEATAHTDARHGQTLYEKYCATLLSLWKGNVRAVREALSKTFCRLHGMGIVSKKQLDDLQIVIPALAGPFSENMKAMEKEIDAVRTIATTIELDAALSQYVYPAILIFGSRLKGYSTAAADIDVAVFVRPEATPKDMETIRALLQKTFAHEKIHGEVMEFWLEKTKQGLGVRDFGETETSIGESSWVHILFGAAWEGNKKTINELQKKLLVPYLLTDEGRIIHGREARGLYLEELERDTLQYRLMHKGFEKFFPSFGGIHTPHADEIDGKSTFWDSGYRRMATTLFARRVFLPKISQPEA